MRFLLLTFALTLFCGNYSMATEEIAYKVIKKDGDIEIRQYQPTVRAEVTVQATRRDASGEAFRTLFNFINGDNVAQEEISMTAPVSQELQKSSQKIPMTAPVSQEQGSDENTWIIGFYMPSDMEFETTPKPLNEAVKITQIPTQKKIIIRFSGRSTDDNIKSHEAKLRDYINGNNIPVIEPPLYAFYNPPWTLPFMRRNEILFTVKE